MVDHHTFKTFNLDHQKLGFIGKNIGRNLSLLYRGSRDGFDTSPIHQCCSGAHPTLLLVKSEYGKVFGAYISIPWLEQQQDASETKAFLFSLDTQEIFTLKRTVKAHVRFDSCTMVGFNGGSKGTDLMIQSECNKRQISHSKLGCMFNVPM